MFIIIETIVNIKHEELTCFKGHRCFSKNLFMSIRHMKKEIPGSYYFSFFALSNLLTQACLHFCTQGSSSSENAKCTFIIYYICFPIFAHILYFDEAKFSIKLVYFTVSVVRQQNEYEIVTETRPIET